MSIFDTLRLVFNEKASFRELQILVDAAIIEDLLPDDLPHDIRSQIYELQTTLELIAEHQATHIGISTFYSDHQIVALLDNAVSPKTQNDIADIH